MTSWKLMVEDFGKIKSAEIEVAPLTLFVGDNNSGKSYLLSLIWGIKNLGAECLFDNHQYEETILKKRLIIWMNEQIYASMKNVSYEVPFKEIEQAFEQLLNEELEKNKNELLKMIFNSEKVTIGKLAICFENLKDIKLEFERNESKLIHLNVNGERLISIHGSAIGKDEHLENGFIAWTILKQIYFYVLRINDVGMYDNSCIYLPAARTGFMLTKDIINKVGRKNTFNISTEKDVITPFIRPINQFVDVMTDLSSDYTENKELLKLSYDIEKEMAAGSVEISNMPNKEVQYVPDGYESGIPLRLTSAVVTELSPLILILKHKKVIESFCYEEPEMCLHPQLQHKMGKVIGRIVNSKIGMIVTTHSDIILQHINNMIKLSSRNDRDEICKELGYDSQDLLTSNQVKVYQFAARKAEKTEVKELLCGEDGFVIPTFNDALNMIMDEAYEIQG